MVDRRKESLPTLLGESGNQPREMSISPFILYVHKIPIFTLMPRVSGANITLKLCRRHTRIHSNFRTAKDLWVGTCKESLLLQASDR
jgi:hypothetical protein